MQLQRTASSAILGAVVSIMTGFVPAVSFVAPLLGGIVAEYVYRNGLRDGAGAGALMGVFLAILGVVSQILGPVLPAFPAAVVLGLWARGFGLGMLSSTVQSSSRALSCSCSSGHFAELFVEYSPGSERSNLKRLSGNT